MRTLVFLLCLFFSIPAFAKDDAIYDRIMKSGTIHCGYSLWNPLTFVEPNTGEIKGIFHDLMEEAGKRLDLKIEWTEELGWGTVVESLQTGRVDMACAGYWLNPTRIKLVSTNAPQLYTPLVVWVRADEKRPFKTLTDLNDPALITPEVDGGATNHVVDNMFPKTRRLNMPESATHGDLVESVLSGKVDFMVDDITSFMAYDKMNPGKLRVLFPDQAVSILPATMLLPPDEPRLKEMIDGAFTLLELDGTLDRILERYGVEHLFLRNPRPAAR
ncbi:MAG: amino acid ABC transporter substrate-binding protein [Rhodospirillales bacterium]|nr:amino acid ABC transporter substrate-binding protein [Alphaproteobacteria bacterium]MCB9987279.1 amino acid ABC transporter substrate-binding protein [Rhodospirillales bacterium]USO07864.1 MAG: amino acid ABC transporter substrate-binding protein [Rhodospirillales bacterium]